MYPLGLGRESPSQMLIFYPINLKVLFHAAIMPFFGGIKSEGPEPCMEANIY